MPRRKKKMKDEIEVNSQGNNLTEQLKKLSEGLYYISETDAEILPFVGRAADQVSPEEILIQTGSEPDALVEERDFAQFFASLTEIQDWFEEEETENARKFAELKDLLERKLKDLKVFRVGIIELDIYAVGLDAESNLMGIQTKAVET